jgi:drug/metabolite transporter (DMT)-like permease
MDSPFVFAWMASFAYGLYAIVAKLIGKHLIKNSWHFAFFSLLFGGIVTSFIAVLNGATLPEKWFFIVMASIFFAGGSALYLLALKNLDVSVMGPLFNIRTVMTVILGVLFLGEVLSGRNTLLIALIVGAGFFAATDERFSVKAFFRKEIYIGLLFMLVLSIQSLLINRAVDQTDYWTATLWIGLLAIGFGWLMLYPRFKHAWKKTSPKRYVGVAGLAVLGGIGDLAAFKAFEGNIGISAVIISLPISMVLAFGFSVFKPDLLEKHTLKVYAVRFAAAAVMIWGALQLST